VVKPQSLRLPGFKCHLHHLKSRAIILARKLTSAMNPLFLLAAIFSHISKEEMQAYVPAMVPSSREVTTAEGTSSILLNYSSSS